MRLKFNFLFVLIFLVTKSVYALPSADTIILKASQAYSKINDYSVDMTLSMHGSSISINSMKTKVYYKKPDKLKIKAKEGFAFVPPGLFQGLKPGELRKNTKNALVLIEDKSGKKCYAVRYESKDIRENLQIATIWFDITNYSIVSTKIEGMGSLTSQWTYTHTGKYYLPSKITAKMQFSDRRGKQEKMTALVDFTNYKVNIGLSDSIFNKTSKDRN